MKRSSKNPPQSESILLSDFLDVEGLARELRVSTKTIHRWKKRKYGPPVTGVGRRILFSRQAVIDWLQSAAPLTARRRARGSR